MVHTLDTFGLSWVAVKLALCQVHQPQDTPLCHLGSPITVTELEVK
jgi:hypothetical protein